MMHLHELKGCSPTPLAHYLKALGILRLVSQQKDEMARGFWKDDTFWLATSLDKDALLRFFLDDYAPTPIVAPWNGGSGFWPKDNKVAIDAITRSTTVRFAAYREVIELAKEAFDGLKESPKGEEKAERVAKLRARLVDFAIVWIDAALVFGSEDLRYPALLGTGGNDGRLDFTNNLMQRLMDLFDESGSAKPASQKLLLSALFAESTDGLPEAAIGQFLPGANGVNPWDFLLMLEGAVALQVAAVRKLEGVDLPQAAAPFAIQGRASGYASASSSDESNKRGEQWMPLWSAPSRFNEVVQLFAEGRLKEGERSARRPVEAARAIRRMGVARGVESFQRYGFIERNGQANLAVPIGRWKVDNDPDLELLQPVTNWIDRVQTKLKDASQSLEILARDLDSACLAVCRESGQPAHWQSLLIALGEAEDASVRRLKKWKKEERPSPIPRLPLRWIEVANDGTAEFRLAVALASQSDFSGKLGPVRAHCVPLDSKYFSGFDDEETARVVWSSSAPLVNNLVTLLERRLMEGKRAGLDLLPLQSRWPAPIDDVELFIEGKVDERRIAALARGLMAVDWRKPIGIEAEREAQEVRSHWRARLPKSSTSPLPLHALFRLCLLNQKLSDESDIPADATILRLLSSGRLADAGSRAIRHLGAHGQRVRLRQIFGSAEFAHRLAASAAFPLSRDALDRLKEAALKPEEAHENLAQSL